MLYLIGEKMSGESDEIFPRQNISPTFYHPTKTCTRFFYPRPKHLPEILYRNQNSNLISLHLDLPKLISALNIELQGQFSS